MDDISEPVGFKSGVQSFCNIRHSCDWLHYQISDDLVPGLMYSTSITHYSDVVMGTMASQITSLVIVYSSVCSGADQRKHQSSASLALVLGIHRWPVNSPHKWPVTRKVFPFDDVIMTCPRVWSVVLCFVYAMVSQIAKLKGPTWGPPGSCRP